MLLSKALKLNKALNFKNYYSSNNIINTKPANAPSLLRHLAAVMYDALLLLAVLFVATIIVLALNSGATFLPEQRLLIHFFRIYLLAVSYLFFGWFWTHGGQTPGLRAWKIKVLTNNGNTINWQQALARFCWALLSWAACGLGFIWVLFDKNNLSWHDKLSKTRLVHSKN